MTKDMINNGVNSDDKSRIIQEYVPGKQITLAHMVTRPKASVYKKLGLPDDYHDAIGILTITPSEATIIAADICTKAASIKLGFVDRFSGSVIIVGSTSMWSLHLTVLLLLFIISLVLIRFLLRRPDKDDSFSLINCFPLFLLTSFYNFTDFYAEDFIILRILCI